MGVHLRNTCPALLVLRGMEGGAVGHFCDVHALHLRMGKGLLDTLAQAGPQATERSRIL